MEELLKNDKVKQKIKSLSPHMRRAYIEALLDLFEQETEDMIDAIEESRMELRGTMIDFEDESEQLRAQSRMLEQRRHEYDQYHVDRYLDKKGRRSQASRAHSRVSYVNEQSDENRQAVLSYIRHKEGRRLDSRSSSSLSVPSTPQPQRPISVISSRSLPTPVMTKTILEKETDAIMQNLTAADLKQQSERQRQAELMEMKRQKRREEQKTREEKALQLLETALIMDKQLVAKKEEQEQKLKSRLEEMKKRKDKENFKDSEEYREPTPITDFNIEKYI